MLVVMSPSLETIFGGPSWEPFNWKSAGGQFCQSAVHAIRKLFCGL